MYEGCNDVGHFSAPSWILFNLRHLKISSKGGLLRVHSASPMEQLLTSLFNCTSAAVIKVTLLPHSVTCNTSHTALLQFSAAALNQTRYLCF